MSRAGPLRGRRVCHDASRDTAHVPVVVRAAGSGLSGGANAADGCIVLSLLGVDRIVDIDVANWVTIVQPGVVTGDLKRAVALWSLVSARPASADFLAPLLFPCEPCRCSPNERHHPARPVHDAPCFREHLDDWI